MRGVGCLLALLALISPRLVLFLLWLFSNVLSRAFDSWVVPFLGFFLLPWTTLTYAAFWEWGRGRTAGGRGRERRRAGPRAECARSTSAPPMDSGRSRWDGAPTSGGRRLFRRSRR